MRADTVFLISGHAISGLAKANDCFNLAGCGTGNGRFKFSKVCMLPTIFIKENVAVPDV